MLQDVEVSRLHLLALAAILVAFSLALNVRSAAAIWGALAQMQRDQTLAESEAQELRREMSQVLDRELDRLKREEGINTNEPA